MQLWHERRPNTQHYRWYRNLIDFHAITLGWVRELDAERPSHWLQRGMSMSEDVSETLWMLDRLTATQGSKLHSGASTTTALEDFLDDSSPDDVLGRLEQAIWAVQGWTLSTVLERGAEADRSAIRNQLEQSCWKSGRDCAIHRWPSLPEDVRGDVRGILGAFRDSPLLGRPDHPGILILRNVRNEAQIELLTCPHRMTFGELPAEGGVADDLCHLHAHWMRGFGYALNTKTLIDHHIGKDGRRCSQRWYLASN